MGFHAPQEANACSSSPIDFARQGQLAVRDPGFKPKEPVSGPEGLRAARAPPAGK